MKGANAVTKEFRPFFVVFGVLLIVVFAFYYFCYYTSFMLFIYTFVILLAFWRMYRTRPTINKSTRIV